MNDFNSLQWFFTVCILTGSAFISGFVLGKFIEKHKPEEVTNEMV